MNVAVIGCGYWGNHLLRNFHTSEKWNLSYMCDIDEVQLKKFSQIYQYPKAVTDIDNVLKDETVSTIVIATPVNTHYELAKKAILAGKHVWVEKPLTSNSNHAKELVKLAKEAKVKLHVDHTFVYTSAVRKIKELVDNGTLGDILYFDSVRVNLGLFQHDINVIWDLAPHDLSIMEYTMNKKAVSVNAVGKCLIKYSEKPLENVAYLTINFEDGTLAHFHVNWMSPVKIRHIMMGGSKKMLVFNDMEQMEKIKVYDSGVNVSSREEVYDTLIQYRTGDMHSPAIKNIEALAFECDHFYDSIMNDKDTDTPGESGLEVVKILEAADKSIKNGGMLVNL